MLKNFAPLLVAALTLSSCASESKKSDIIKSDDVYQSYSINYDGDVAYVKAEFRVGAYWNRLETEKTGGDAVELVKPASITFNGEEMTKDNSVFTGTYYSLKTKDPLKSVSWVWTDNSGKKFTNSTIVYPISLNEQKSISLRENFIITWEGAPVQEHETVSITIEGSVNDKEHKTTESTSKVGDTSISFTPEQLKKYEDQSVSIEITRKALIPVAEGTKGGGVISLYYDGNSVTTDLTGSAYLMRDLIK